MRPRRVTLRLLPVPLVWSLFPAVLPAGPDSPRPGPARAEYSEKVHVQLVQINFLATDRKGNPVTDLKAGDVEVLEQGEPQEIAFLLPYDAGKSVLSGRPHPPAGTLESGRVDAVTGQAVVPGRWIVLFFDDWLASQATRIRSLDATTRFMDQELRAGDLVSVVSFDGKLQVVQNFSGDRDILKGACQRALPSAQHAASDRTSDLDTLVDSIETCRSSSLPEACAERYSETYLDSRIREIDALLTALTQLARSLGSVPDIKTLVLFSEGFPRHPASDTADATTVALGRPTTVFPPQDRRVEKSYDQLAQAAAAARVSIFTVNPGAGSRQSGTSARRATPFGGFNAASSIDLYRRSEQNWQQGLVEVARRTGGASTQGADPLDDLRRILSLSPGLYTLGYYPRGDPASGSREVKIKVLRKGVEVESRREVPASPDLPPLNGELSLSPEACSERGRRSVVMKVRLDRSKLLFEKVEGKISSNFSLYIRILAEGRPEPLHHDYHFFNISYTPEEFASGRLPDPSFEQTLIVPCRGLIFTVSATDASSGAHAVFTASLPPPPPSSTP